MKWYVVLILCLCIPGLVILSGCTGTTGGGTPSTPTSPQVTTPPPQQTGGSINPGPTQTMPPGKNVGVDVMRNQISTSITVTFRGGEGQFQVREMEARLTRSDGKTDIKRVSKPAVGAELVFEGTKGKDRIEVYISLITNEQFKIIDKVYDYNERA